MKNFVFIGDSVTDCDRKRSKKHAETEGALGHGWVKILAHSTLKHHKVWNRGFSGYRTADILTEPECWPVCVKQADVTTLMVGINDIWHTIKQCSAYNEDEIVDHFETLVKQLKVKTKTLIVLEPVALLIEDVDEYWLPKMSSLFSLFKEVADQQGAQWIPLQTQLERVARPQLADYLFDGIHPSPKGHQWIAQQWSAQVPTTLWDR